MTTKVRAYGNWTDQFKDGLSEWFWTEIVGKAIVVGVVISIPMAAAGGIMAPTGTTRAQHAYDTTVAGHSFLWDYAGKAANATFEVLDNINNND
jgi:hypothetical protein